MQLLRTVVAILLICLTAGALLAQISSDSLLLKEELPRMAYRFGVLGGGVYASDNRTTHFPIYSSSADHKGIQPFLGCWYASGYERAHLLIEMVWERQHWTEHYAAPKTLADNSGNLSGYIRRGVLEKRINLLRLTESLVFPLNKGWQLRTGFDLGVALHVISEDATARVSSTGQSGNFTLDTTTVVTIAAGRDLVSPIQLALMFGVSKEFTFGWYISTSASIGFTKWATEPYPEKIIPLFGRTSIGKTLFGPRKK